MFSSPFYFNTTSNLIKAFGTIFNNIYIKRTKGNKEEVERFLVPIAPGATQSWFARNKQDPFLTSGNNLKVPRMSYGITSIKYNSDHKLNTTIKSFKVKEDDNSKVSVQYKYVPYVISFELSIIAKNQDDAFQIFEQIVPFFTPSYTVAIKYIPEMETVLNVPILLTGTTIVDNYDSTNFNERRDVLITLTFDANVNYFGNIRDENIITKVQTDFHTSDNSGRQIRSTVTPDPSDALKTDNYDTTVVVQDFADGKSYNPETGQDE